MLERRREGLLEAIHHGAAVAVDAAGAVIAEIGDAAMPVLPRSAAKLLLSLPFLASGAAPASTTQEIVLASASHAGTPAQIDVLRAWAERLGLREADLACGPDFPLGRSNAAMLAGAPGAIHNNNAGKHLGVLATCLHLGDSPTHYCDAEHPAQRRLIAALSGTAGLPIPTRTVVDNCGMRSFALPLERLAFAMAGFASRAASAGPEALLLDAIRDAPVFFAGPRRLGTRIVALTGGRVIAKGGSEGVFACLDRARGVGHALKIVDGSSEAASATIIAWLAATGALAEQESTALRAEFHFFCHPFAPDRAQELDFPFVGAMSGHTGRKIG